MRRTRGAILPMIAAAAVVSAAVPTVASVECGPESLIHSGAVFWSIPSMALAPDGTAWAVWMASGSIGGAVYAVHDGVGWSSPLPIQDDPEWGDWVPMIDIGSDGVPWVVWQGGAGYPDSTSAYASRWTGASWSHPSAIWTDATSHQLLDICAVNEEDVWVATERQAAGSFSILVYHWDGVSWSAAGQLGPPAEPGAASYPNVRVSPSGEVWVLWDRGTDYPRGIAYSVRADGEWSTPDYVYSGEFSERAKIVFDGEIPMVTWETPVTSFDDIVYSRLVGDSWTEPALVNLPNSDYNDYELQGACKRNAAGEIWAAWLGVDASYYFDRRVTGAKWTGDGWTPERVLTEIAEHRHDGIPDIAVGDDGVLWAVWNSYEEIVPPYSYDIRGTTCVPTTPVDFALLRTEERNGAIRVSWYAGGVAEHGPFFIWRSDIEAREAAPGSNPPPAASLLNDAPVTTAPFEWLDETAIGGVRHDYWVEWRRAGSSTYLGPATATLNSPDGPPAQILFASPNPTRADWCIGFQQTRAGTVTAEIYNVAGRRVAQLSAGARPPGRYDDSGSVLCWNGRSDGGLKAAAGVYLVHLTFDGAPLPGQTATMTLLR